MYAICSVCKLILRSTNINLGNETYVPTRCTQCNGRRMFRKESLKELMRINAKGNRFERVMEYAQLYNLLEEGT